MPQPIMVRGDGWRGILHSWPSDTDAREITVRLDTGETLLIPAALFRAEPDGSYYVPLPYVTPQGTPGPIVIPVIHEELEVAIRKIETGAGVRIEKSAYDEQQTVDLPLIHERVDVERVPADRLLDGPLPVRHVGDTIVVPVMQEVLVVHKQLRLVEELHIRKRRTEQHEPQLVTIRKETVTVERLERPGDAQ